MWSGYLVYSNTEVIIIQFDTENTESRQDTVLFEK